MECPVCPFEEIPANETLCPNCHTDLTPLNRIRELGSVHFNQALRFAHNGQYHQAMNWASSAACLSADAAHANILRGKLLWREGRCQDAVRVWESALVEDPENTVIPDLLEEAGQHIRNAEMRRAARRAGALIFAAAVVLAVLWISISLYSRNLELQSKIASSNELIESLRSDHERYKTGHRYDNSQMAAVGGELADIGRQLSAVKDTYPHSASEITDLKRALSEVRQTMAAYRHSHRFSNREVADMQTRLQFLEDEAQKENQNFLSTTALLKDLSTIKGVMTSQDIEKGSLKFEKGLFTDNLDRISRPGRNTLDQIIDILNQQHKPFRILVEGHTDDRPIVQGTDRWHDNWSLGFYRANLVLAYLQRHLTSPKMQLACFSAGASNPPFSDATGRGSRNNRTVVLHFVPGTQMQ